MIDLVLERRPQADETVRLGIVELPPLPDDDYWAYRVRLTATQAVLAFPKFGTIGIGMAVEGDGGGWNTNLPYTCQTIDITSHIWCNARVADPDYFAEDCGLYDEDRNITIAGVYRAVELLQAAIGEDHPGMAAPNSRPSMVDQRWKRVRLG